MAAPAFPTWLLAEWQSLPREVRCAPATHPQLEAFESAHGAIPAQYRSFLMQFGGGPVGHEWIDGIDQLTATQEKFRAGRRAGHWKMASVFVVGWDGAGNPIGIDSHGAVIVELPGEGVQRLAGSFAEYVAKGFGHQL